LNPLGGKKMDKKEVILLDVDGVLRDLMRYCCMIYKRGIDPQSTATPKDIVEWDFDPVFPKLPQAHKVFFGPYAEELFSEAEPYDPAFAQCVAELKEGNELIIATDQFNGNGIYTLGWLDRYKVPYDGIFISPNKTLIKGTVALDDRLKTLNMYKDAGIYAVCMNRPWNEGRWDGPLVHDLNGFYLLLQDLKNAEMEKKREMDFNLNLY
jgi:hypothetical protein